MKPPTGYRITQEIYTSYKTLVYRGIRESDQKPVILKTLNTEFPTLAEITRLKHEYKILKNINLDGVAKIYALEKCQHSYVLIQEDFNARSLKDIILDKNTEKFNIADTLKLFIEISNTLGEIHTNQIIHKDINPSNILINSELQQIKIADFSISSCLNRENHQLSNFSLLEGTPAYISPEQTGRMNRTLDYRTDLYSLGVTIYEMLTGQLPFSNTDLLELIHCHISQLPIPPHQLNSEVPEEISALVMKLLSKNADERYQSAFGLKYDLEICLHQLLNVGNIYELNLGGLDHSSQFLIPQKLYGRSQEVNTLKGAFEHVSTGAVEIIFISGYSGVGKTSIVNEVHKSMVQHRGYFISGKFDQFQRDIPYSALIKAFHSLINQLLTEPSDRIQHWQDVLLSNIGHNGQVLIDVIPEIELIIGPQNPVPKLGLTESQNRFNQVFKDFISVFTQEEHPLVFFLDDLQWADSDSLNLLQLLLTDPSRQYLLVIGAYRDNEVSSTHILLQTIKKIQQFNPSTHNIFLEPLGINCIRQLVNDTLNCEDSRSTPLTDFIFNITAGNPFFLTQFLQTLHQEEFLKFDFSEQKWKWDMEQIQAIKISDYNVVDLVARNLLRLPKHTQEVLKLASCIGNQFDLNVLSTIRQKKQSDTASDLWEALQEGLVIPLSDAYKIPLVVDQDFSIDTESLPEEVKYRFLHDRVQQASYSLIPDPEKKYTHLKIGRLLLEYNSFEILGDNIFDIVNHMNVGLELIESISERNQLAELNLIAGKKAKSSAAYESAARYFRLGIKLLSQSSWQDQYDLTFSLYIEALESEYINTNFENAKKLSELILKQSRTLVEQVRVHELKIPYYFSQNQLQEAIDTALDVLTMLGINLPRRPNKLNILLGLLRTKLTQGRQKIDDLIHLPSMTEPTKIAAMQILMAVIPAAFVARPNLFPLVVLKMVNLSLVYGNSSLSAVGYNNYGTICCAILKDIESGFRYNQLALSLQNKYNSKELKSRIYFVFNAFVRHWKEPLSDAVKSLKEGLNSGLETGDVEHVGHCSAFYCSYLYSTGEPLDYVYMEHEKHIDLLKKYKQDFDLIHVQIWSQTISNLMHPSDNINKLVGLHFDEEVMMPILKESNNIFLFFPIYLSKSILSYFFKKYDQSVEYSLLAEQHIEAVIGSIYVPIHNFFASLGLLALYKTASIDQQNKYLHEVRDNQKKLAKWASHAPANNLHKYELIEAELARVLGQDHSAGKLYDRAISNANNSKYFQEEALANELAAEFYFSQNRDKIARVYLIDAYYGYVRWKAWEKVKDLESTYPQFLSQKNNQDKSLTQTISISNSSQTTTQDDLDLAIVLKASQAISVNIVLDELLNSLMKILVESAGAQNGCLIINKAEELWIEAVRTSENNGETIRRSVAVNDSRDIPISIINYVARTKDKIVLNDATADTTYASDPYIQKIKSKSILCFPLLNQGILDGIVYLENNLTTNAFRRDHIEILKLLCAQASISLKNATLYKDLQESKAREQAEKELNELKSRFISITSHEFRTPLTTILGATEVLKHYGQNWSASKKETYLDRIQTNVKHMNNLLEDVLVLSKGEAGKTEFNPLPLNLIEFCQNLVEEFQLGEHTTQELIFSCQGQCSQAHVDEKLLRHILSNLLSNAIKYSPDGSIIQFKLTYKEPAHIFQIQDQGIGIPVKDQKHLFDSFHRASNVGKINGTGLGMSIVKNAVDRHGGTITVDSTVDIGTTITVAIPVEPRV